MNTVFQDIRLGFRLMKRSPGMSIAAVLSLAVGIGAAASVVSLTDALGFRPLPVHAERQLVRVLTVSPDRSPGESAYPDYLDLRDRNHVFSEVMAHGLGGVALQSASGDTAIGFVDVATWNYFRVLGVRPALGRAFLPEDDRPGARPVAVISDRLWRSRFGGDPAIVGRRVRLTGRDCTIVGVAPPQFTGTVPILVPDVWVPISIWPLLARSDLQVRDRNALWLEVVGRLKEGIGIDQARAEMEVLAAHLAAEHPVTNRERKAVVVRESTARADQMRDLAPALFAGVAVVLFIACVNVAGLLLARGETQRAELAVRAALGATRGRLLRQLLTESALLSASAVCVGLLFAAWITAALPWLTPPSPIPLHIDTRLDVRVVSIAGLLGMLVLPLFGLVPALESVRRSAAALPGSPPVSGRMASRTWMRSLAVGAQIAVSLALLASAGLLTRSVLNGRQMDLGFEPRPMLLVTMIPSIAGYDEAGSRQLYDRIFERLAALPGVEASTLARRVPLSPIGGLVAQAVIIPGYGNPGERPPEVRSNIVRPGYFATLGTRILRGRDFNAADRPGARRVVLVNETMARRFWPNQDPIGRRFRFPDRPDDIEIVGLVQDGPYVRLGEDPLPVMYSSFNQVFFNEMTLVVRTAGNAAASTDAVRRVLRETAPGVPMVRMVTLDEHLQLAMFVTRTAAALTSVLGGLALLFAAVGLYALVAFSISKRTREFAIRLAIGARPVVLQRHVLRQSLGTLFGGMALGLSLAVGAGFALRRLLLGVRAGDPLTLAASAGLVACAVLLSTYLPSRRISQLDPATGLREG